MDQFRNHTLKGATPSSSESRNWMQTAMFLAWKEKNTSNKKVLMGRVSPGFSTVVTAVSPPTLVKLFWLSYLSCWG